MTKTEIELSVIVPAYNEAERIRPTLKRLHEYLTSRSLKYEILVVVEGATDVTLDVVRAASDAVPDLRLLDRPTNYGKGHSVKAGMLHAQGRVRLFTDADNSTDISHFDLMKPLFDLDYDVVIASRSSRDARGARQSVPQAFYKQAIARSGNLLIQALAVPGIWDTQCGFKAFRAETAERIFSRMTIDGWGFDIEALALARAMKYKIGIIPANWTNDTRSHFAFSDYLRVLLDTVRVRYNFLVGKYGLSAERSLPVL